MESVLGIAWKSQRSDASTDCYFTYVLDRSITKLRKSAEHRLNEHDLDDCRQVVFMHAQRCIKYFNPDKAKISTFVTRLVKQGVHKFLEQHYSQPRATNFSDMPEGAELSFGQEILFGPDQPELGTADVLVRRQDCKKKAKRNQLSMF